jgi:hypothetical protein
LRLKRETPLRPTENMNRSNQDIANACPLGKPGVA